MSQENVTLSVITRKSLYPRNATSFFLANRRGQSTLYICTVGKCREYFEFSWRKVQIPVGSHPHTTTHNPQININLINYEYNSKHGYLATAAAAHFCLHSPDKFLGCFPPFFRKATTLKHFRHFFSFACWSLFVRK